jgi:carboxyl-terminal processing protease
VSQQKGTDPQKRTKNERFRSLLGPLKNVAILLFIFWLGVSFGNGSIQLSHAVSGNEKLPNNLDYSSVERVYDELRNKYDGKLSVDQLTDGLKAGLVNAAGDPYTEYFSAKEAKDFDKQLIGNSFGGIGAKLGKDDKGNIVVESPLAGYPAEKAGLRAKDLILSIDGKSTVGMSADAAVKLIRGKAGTVVKLQILRNGTETKDLSITRDNIEVPNVQSQILDGNIGYLQVVQFSSDPAFPDQVRGAADEFKRAHVKGVILDLRGNPGGSLDAAVDMASIWLPEGKTVIQEKRDNKLDHTYTANGRTLLQGVPTVVLIDGGSASAAEIVAGALKDNSAATLIGTKSYGKGSVQQVLGFNDGSELKVTVARWYRPNGENINKKGIQPDTKVDISEQDLTNAKDPQKDAAIQKLLNQ